MTWETIRLTRDELYELVWSRPLVELAKQYGMSDVGLAKACRRLQVPIPGRGYWARKEAGRAPPQPPLPDVDANVQSQFTLTRRIRPPCDPDQVAAGQSLMAFEQLPENRLTVGAELTAAHPLVALTDKSLRSVKPDQTGLVGPRAKGCLDVRVAPASIDRAMRIVDTLAKALELRATPLTVDRDSAQTRVTVLGVTQEIALDERVDRKERLLTPAQKKDQLKQPWLYHTTQYDYTPSGRLALRIKGYGDGERRSWCDGKQQRVEDCLNAFMMGLIESAIRQCARDLEHQRWQREWEERERRERDAERRRRLEAAWAADLDQKLADWARSQQIRKLIDTVRRTALKRHGAIEPEGGLQRWINWATTYADRLDPLGDNLEAWHLVTDESNEPSYV